MAASRTGRRAPAAPGRARPAPRSSPAVASCTARTPRDYAQRTPKKMKAAALRGALSDRARDGRVHVVEPLLDGRRRRRPRARSSALAADLRAQARARRASSARRRDLAEPAQRRRACTCWRPTSSTPTTCWSPTTSCSPRRALDAFLAGPTRARAPRPSPRRPRPSHRACRGSEHEQDRRPPRRPARARDLREELRPARREQVHVPGRARTPTRPRSRSRSSRSSASRSTGVNTLNRQGKRSAPAPASASARTPSAPSSASPRATASTSSAGRSPDRLAEQTHRRGSDSAMGIRKYKPTTPGRRGSSVADFVEVTRSDAGEVARPPAAQQGRPQQPAAGSPPGTRVAATSAPTGVIDFRRHDKDGVPAKVAHIEYDPNRTARIALLHYADGEKRYIIAPQQARAGRPRRERPLGRHQAGQQPAAAQHPGRHRHPRHRAAARWRRQDRPLRRRERPARGQGRPVRPAADALRRDPQRRRPLPRHGRRGRQRRAVATSTGARPAACAGRASARPSAVSP